MATSEYDWRPTAGSPSNFKVETSRNIGWWVLLALLVSVILHVGMYVVMDGLNWGAGATVEDEIIFQNKNKQLTIDRDKLDQLLAPDVLPQDEAVVPEKLSDMETLKDSLDEFDLMEKFKDEPIRMSPVDTPQVFGKEAPKIANMALGVAEASIDISTSDVLSQDLQDMRKKLIENSATVSNAQPLMELNTPEKDTIDTDDFFRNAAKKAFGNEDGDKFVKGYSTLDGLIGATGGQLPVGEEKILMPTDILFEYNEHELKEEARLSMMKLAFLVQTNTDANFLIEGHTDTIGGDDFNKTLSLKRAEAVRSWLTKRLKIEAKNIKVVGLGKVRPLVSPDGSKDEQSLNRRVEIVINKG